MPVDPKLEWRYQGDDTIPTIDYPDGDMPNLKNTSEYGARDGHDTRVSQIHSLRDMAIDNRNLLSQWRTWNYIELAQPSGMGTAAEALYQFTDYETGNLDRTENGHDLTYYGSGNVYQPIEGMVCLGFNHSNYLRTQLANTGNLRIAGALTVEMVAQLNNVPEGEGDILLVCGGAGETSATNQLYSFQIIDNNCRWHYFCEYGSGSDRAWQSDTMMNCGALQHYVFTRNGSTGQVKIYINGALCEQSGSVGLPNGGSSAYLYLGRSVYSEKYFHGFVSSVKITAAEFSASQVAAAYATVTELV